MAIQSVNSGNPLTNAAAAKPAGKNANDSQSPALNSAAEEDTVRLTNTAQDIKKASDAAMSAPMADEKRVAEVKAALEAGNYQINPGRIADRMLQLEAKLPDTT